VRRGCAILLGSIMSNGLEITSRFRGTLLGAATADALALPHLHYSRAFLRSLASPMAREYVSHPSGRHPAGQYSSLTQEMMAVVASILDEGEVSGEAIASHLTPLWRDQVLIERDAGSVAPMERLVSRSVSWQTAANEVGHAEAAPACRVVPVALWRPTDVEALQRGVVDAVTITHRDPRVLAAAAAMAAAIAVNSRTEELILGPFLDRVAGAAERFDAVVAEAILDFPRTLSMSENRAIRHFESLCPDDRYPPSDEGLGSYCVPAALLAVYYFLRSPYRFEKTVESCLRLGGHMHVPAFFAGAISGALNGEDGLPDPLLQGLVGWREIAEAADTLERAWLLRGAA
jgi:ADP-ribosylglycohydrolase